SVVDSYGGISGGTIRFHQNLSIISSQPANVTANVGANPSFSVSSSSTFPVSYQWFFNGASLLNATNASLLLNNVGTNNAGPYSVLVSTAPHSELSAAATLTVVDVFAVMINQPSSTNVKQGTTVTLTDDATP